MADYVLISAYRFGWRSYVRSCHWRSDLLFAIRTGRNLFSPESILAQRERKVGDALRLELQRMHPPEKRKNEDKPSKVEYTVGDDGELIEVDSADRDDKSKRDGL